MAELRIKKVTVRLQNLCTSDVENKLLVAKRERKGGGIKCKIGIDIYTLLWNRASLVAQMVKNQPAMQETWI